MAAPAEVNVAIEYCGAWGYYSRFLSMQRALASHLPTAKVSGGTGRSSSFEVVVNGMNVWSKLAAGSFPDFAGLAKEIAEFAKSGSVPSHWKKA